MHDNLVNDAACGPLTVWYHTAQVYIHTTIRYCAAIPIVRYGAGFRVVKF